MDVAFSLTLTTAAKVEKMYIKCKKSVVYGAILPQNLTDHIDTFSHIQYHQDSADRSLLISHPSLTPQLKDHDSMDRKCVRLHVNFCVFNVTAVLYLLRWIVLVLCLREREKGGRNKRKAKDNSMRTCSIWQKFVPDRSSIRRQSAIS